MGKYVVDDSVNETLMLEAKRLSAAAQINEWQYGRQIAGENGEKVGSEVCFRKVQPHLVLDLMEIIDAERPEHERRFAPELFWDGVDFYRMRRAFTQPMQVRALRVSDSEAVGVMHETEGVRLADKFVQVTDRLSWMEQRVLAWVCWPMVEMPDGQAAVRIERRKLYAMEISVRSALERLSEIIAERVKANWGVVKKGGAR